MNDTDDIALLKLAEAEILGEAKRATVRHATAGTSGWQPAPKMNKSFLVNTLLHTLSSNRILSRKQGHPERINRKLLQRDKNITKNNFIYQKNIPKESKKIVKKKEKEPLKFKSSTGMKKGKHKCKKKNKIKR